MLVSIIIPCHNCAETIDRAVESVLSQTYQDWELILVNNNSVDTTWERLERIKERNSNQSITILDEKKIGAPAARNKGLYQAKGEWLQFLDSDDELLPQKIEKQLDLVIKYSTTDVIYSSYIKIKTIGESITEVKRHIERDYWKGFITSNLGITSANLFNKNAVLKVNGWDESKTSSQEYDLMFRIAENNGVFLAYDYPLSLIHYREDSISNSSDSIKTLKRLANFLQLRTKIINSLKNKKKINKEYQELYDKVISHSCIMSFRENPRKVFTQFNKIKEVSLLTNWKTNWIFVKLSIRIFFNILPK